MANNMVYAPSDILAMKQNTDNLANRLNDTGHFIRIYNDGTSTTTVKGRIINHLTETHSSRAWLKIYAAEKFINSTVIKDRWATDMPLRFGDTTTTSTLAKFQFPIPFTSPPCVTVTVSPNKFNWFASTSNVTNSSFSLFLWAVSGSSTNIPPKLAKDDGNYATINILAVGV